jgi:hypothetical protein
VCTRSGRDVHRMQTKPCLSMLSLWSTPALLDVHKWLQHVSMQSSSVAKMMTSSSQRSEEGD